MKRKRLFNGKPKPFFAGLQSTSTTGILNLDYYFLCSDTTAK